MTAFKEKLDRAWRSTTIYEVLTGGYFTASAANKKTRRWSYPLIIVGTIVMLLLLIEMGPLGQMEQTKQASIVQLAQQETIKNIQ